MSLGIRNQIPATVTSVQEGAVTATVKLRLAEGQELTAAVTKESVKELGIATSTVRPQWWKKVRFSSGSGPVSWSK